MPDLSIDCLISASYDLHGNLSQRVIDSLNMLTAFRTAPHLDWYETLERACAMLGRGYLVQAHSYIQFREGPLRDKSQKQCRRFQAGIIFSQ